MPRAADSISTTLLGRVRETDPVHGISWLLSLDPLIYHWARKSNLSEADAADIVQEVFIAYTVGLGRSNGKWQAERSEVGYARLHGSRFATAFDGKRLSRSPRVGPMPTSEWKRHRRAGRR